MKFFFDAPQLAAAVAADRIKKKNKADDHGDRSFRIDRVDGRKKASRTNVAALCGDCRLISGHFIGRFALGLINGPRWGVRRFRRSDGRNRGIISDISGAAKSQRSAVARNSSESGRQFGALSRNCSLEDEFDRRLLCLSKFSRIDETRDVKNNGGNGAAIACELSLLNTRSLNLSGRSLVQNESEK